MKANGRCVDINLFLSHSHTHIQFYANTLSNNPFTLTHLKHKESNKRNNRKRKQLNNGREREGEGGERERIENSLFFNCKIRSTPTLLLKNNSPLFILSHFMQNITLISHSSNLPSIPTHQ